MKKFIFYASALLMLSCNSQTYVEHVVECTVTSCEAYERYPGLFPDRSYRVTTDCGYVLRSIRPIPVGEIVPVVVRTPQ